MSSTPQRDKKYFVENVLIGMLERHVPKIVLFDLALADKCFTEVFLKITLQSVLKK